MRYIHLPIGYDGVSTQRVAELVKAAQTSQGPLYVHCHHGKHRGPAAVAVICEATAGWTTNQAVTWLKEAGTAADYPGLYRSAMDFRLPEAAVLASIVELPEVARTSSVIDAMVAIDRLLKLQGGLGIIKAFQPRFLVVLFVGQLGYFPGLQRVGDDFDS